MLDRFITALHGEGSGRPQRLLLRLALEGAGADIAFVYSGEGRIVERSGAASPGDAECIRVARSLIEAEPGDRGHRSGGAGIIRLSRSRDLWLVALSLNPDRPIDDDGLGLMSAGARLLAARLQQDRLNARLREALTGLIRCLSAAIDAKDPYTYGHSERVGRIASRLGRQLGLGEAEASDLYLAGLLHDIGKIGVRDDVLGKAGPLTEAEAEHARRHPAIGDDMLANVDQLAYLRPGVRSHHERLDGKGYPDGLAGDAIPMLARIMAVADSCDAMLSARRYRRALPQAEVETRLADGAGTQWDARVVEAFLACRRDIYAIAQVGLGASLAAAVDRAAKLGEGSSYTPVTPTPGTATTH